MRTPLSTKKIKKFITLPNIISMLRFPLALLFVIDNTAFRVGVLVATMFTDCLDGFLARRHGTISQWGIILDPIMDKLFVYIAISVLFFKSYLLPWEMLTMLSRDVSLFIFLVYLLLSKKWKTFEFRSLRWGKLTTAAQFLVLILLTVGQTIPIYVYYLFVLFGGFALVELFYFSKVITRRKPTPS
ncbi:CDP-diacylglycerol--glycerol-3-phosphate 3-phosphatidyltransferase [Candidatus Aerophobetes bacterium]|uniref:CDP-diacylglycerol--glycerol-3-phosphate 3-phosphatidyltransferase n=1 Tax=Aerophobetes bacterium TaxID=2030807 RepID=A0A2A4X0E8_UNCAE|nr:MAG: CDP-diacylglycerol--glycerol-3-phosphate 3-phosphatidyltransferase [Candidatus Aerophobetes bacterium]